jgi:hypothetical protein
MQTLKWVLFLAANIPAYAIVGKIVFGNWDGLFETWRDASVSPDPPNMDNFKIWGYVLWVVALLAAELHFLPGLVF